MVEVLVALAILGILLTALATAFNASAMNYRQNRGIAEAMNNARQAMARMTALIRTGQPNPADTSTDSCSLLSSSGQDITFRYVSSQKKLYCTVGDVMTQPANVLCDNVTALRFDKTIEGTDVKSVVITMTVTVGDVSETISSAAVVRKNLP
jgi:type II secretory pathway pseudopilin PulG